MVYLKSRFYGQIRQWLFSRVSTDVLMAEAIPYLEEVLTENWLRQELLFWQAIVHVLKAETNNCR